MLDANLQGLLDSTGLSARQSGGSRVSQSPQQSGQTFSSYLSQSQADTSAAENNREKQAIESTVQTSVKSVNTKQKEPDTTDKAREQKPSDSERSIEATTTSSNENVDAEQVTKAQVENADQSVDTVEDAHKESVVSVQPETTSVAELVKLIMQQMKADKQGETDESNMDADEKKNLGQQIAAVVSHFGLANKGQTGAEWKDQYEYNGLKAQTDWWHAQRNLAIPIRQDVEVSAMMSAKEMAEKLKFQVNEQQQSNLSEIILEQDEAAQKQESGDLLLKLLDKSETLKIKPELALQSQNSAEKAFNLEVLEQLGQRMASSEQADKPLMMNALNPAQRTLSAAPTASQFTLQTHVAQPGWSEDFSKRIHFMIKSNIQQAELRLDPPELGKIHVRINLNQDSASMTFSAAHASVRDAIEASLPKLRELLSESGLQLGNADVTSQQHSHHGQKAHDDATFISPRYGRQSADYEDSITASPPGLMQQRALGVIDYFA